MTILFDRFSTLIWKITDDFVIPENNLAVFGNSILINTTEYFKYSSSILTTNRKLQINPINGLYQNCDSYFLIDTAYKSLQYYKELKEFIDTITEPKKLLFESTIKHH